MSALPAGSRRVAMVVRNAVVHDARVLREARAVAGAGFEVTVVGEQRRGSAAEEMAGDVRIVRIRPHSTPLAIVTKIVLAAKRLGAPGRMLADALEPLRRALRAHAFQLIAGRTMAALKPAIYHCHDFNTLWAAHVATRLYPAPFVYDAHEIYLHQSLPRFTRGRKILVRTVEGRMIRRAAAVVAANATYGGFLTRTYGVASPVVVRNIPDDLGAPPQPHSFGEGGPVLLYVGGIVAGRGIATTIRALPEIPGARFICVGPVVREAYQREYEALASELGVADRVRFEPPVPPNAVTAMAAGADVGLCLIEDVSLSYRLSLPNKLFECMHAGVPVVGSSFPEIGGLIDRYGFGVTCDPADPHAIARAVRSILDDPGRAAEMRERARAAARENTWDAEARVLQELYGKLVAA